MHTRRPVRVLAAVLLLSLLFAAIPAAAKVGQVYYTVIDGLNVHEKANGKSEVLGVLHRDDPVIHLSTRNGMWRVRAKGGEGFVKPRTQQGDPNLTLEAFEQEGVYKIKGISHAPVRVEADKSSKKIGTFKRGTLVQLKRLSGYWGYVHDKTGNAGWVRLKFLKPA